MSGAESRACCYKHDHVKDVIGAREWRGVGDGARCMVPDYQWWTTRKFVVLKNHFQKNNETFVQKCHAYFSLIASRPARGAAQLHTLLIERRWSGEESYLIKLGLPKLI